MCAGWRSRCSDRWPPHSRTATGSLFARSCRAARLRSIEFQVNGERTQQEANPAPEAVLRSTVLGLLAPRRAIPIALVVVPLTIIQDAYSRDPLAVPLALLMCGSFLL